MVVLTDLQLQHASFEVTREEAIKQLYELEFYCASEADSGENGSGIWQADIKALDMAIAALREQEERSKGCHRCNTFDKERRLQVNLLADFCPQCGRRLEEV